MGKSDAPRKWELIQATDLFADMILWAFVLFAVAVGLVTACWVPKDSQENAMELFLNIISVFFGVGVAAVGLVFGLLTGEIFKYFRGQPKEIQQPLNKIIGKCWFIFSFDCMALLAIFLCIPLFYVLSRPIALFVVSTLALLIIGSTYNLLNTAFALLGVIRELPNSSETKEADSPPGETSGGGETQA